jgi:nitroreductase
MADLTSLLAFRWSPRAFDPAAELTDAETSSLLEAARWAPSAGNAQPWRFAVGHRDDEAWKRILVNLPVDDQRWARHASALLVGAHVTATPDLATLAGQPAQQAAYDLGQAMAHLGVQATALGLHVHQLVDVDSAGLGADLELPAGVRPLVVAAVGRLGDPFSLPEELRRRETGLRRRRPLAELLLR